MQGYPTSDGYMFEQLPDSGYMEQEEEWEREGLLDPAWEKQQRKVSKHFLHSSLTWSVCISPFDTKTLVRATRRIDRLTPLRCGKSPEK